MDDKTITLALNDDRNMDFKRTGTLTQALVAVARLTFNGDFAIAEVLTNGGGLEPRRGGSIVCQNWH
jgi:hypothetical protein